MGSRALELYKEFAAQSDEDMDFSGIITWLENLNRG